MTSSELSAAKRLATEARREIPAALLQVSGRALYSPAYTLVRGSAFYFLGVNPGEAPDAAHLHSQLTADENQQPKGDSGQVFEVLNVDLLLTFWIFCVKQM